MTDRRGTAPEPTRSGTPPTQPRLLLLDFDGPVCSLFSGMPSVRVADAVRALLHRTRIPVSGTARTTVDPFAVWASVAHRRRISATVEQTIRAHELAASRICAPTPGADEVLAACRNHGVPVVIVSNNSEAAIRAYLARTGLAKYVHDVAARRPGARFATLKPAPDLVGRGLAMGAAEPSQALMVGDSAADVAAAGARGVACVGYVARSWRRGTLRRAGALYEIDKLPDLLRLIDRAPTQVPEP